MGVFISSVASRSINVGITRSLSSPRIIDELVDESFIHKLSKFKLFVQMNRWLVHMFLG